MVLFYILATLLILQGLYGVREGFRYHLYVRRALRRRRTGQPTQASPLVSVIVPCKGLDFEFRENIEAVLTQDYPNYEVIFVTATSDDSSLPVLQPLAVRFPDTKIKFVIAGLSDQRGEKVNNLIEALRHIDSRSEILVFTDSDARPHRTWLRDLVEPLADERVGVSSGYRWFFPVRGNLASLLRTAWNGSVATLLGNHNHNFAWGGSMAIRRTTFERTNVLAFWDRSISDDYSLTRAVKQANLRVHFEPRCLLASYGDCAWRELLEWSLRQIVITKIYSRRLWQLAIFTQFAFVMGFWWAVGLWLLKTWQAVTTQNFFALAQWTEQAHQCGAIAGIIFLLSAVRGFMRMRSVQIIHPRERASLNRFWWGFVLLPPLVSTLTAYNLLFSLLTSTVEWRGVRYRLISPTEVHVKRR